MAVTVVAKSSAHGQPVDREQLDRLKRLSDETGAPIFSRICENNQWVDCTGGACKYCARDSSKLSSRQN
jgi:hypothetical protein